MTVQRILVVEPDPLVRQPLTEYLRECGYVVLEAINSDEALSILNQSGVSLDLVVSEVKSPGQFDGFGLARWIRKNRPGVKIILAGTVEKAVDTAAHLCEEGPVIDKPYHHHFLLERIRSALANRERVEHAGGLG